MAGQRHAMLRGLEGIHTTVMGRNAHRPARIAADVEWRHPGGERRRSASGRATWCPRQIPGVVRTAEDRVLGKTTTGEHGQIRFSQENAPWGWTQLIRKRLLMRNYGYGETLLGGLVLATASSILGGTAGFLLGGFAGVLLTIDAQIVGVLVGVVAGSLVPRPRGVASLSRAVAAALAVIIVVLELVGPHHVAGEVMLGMVAVAGVSAFAGNMVLARLAAH